MAGNLAFLGGFATQASPFQQFSQLQQFSTGLQSGLIPAPSPLIPQVMPQASPMLSPGISSGLDQFMFNQQSLGFPTPAAPVMAPGMIFTPPDAQTIAGNGVVIRADAPNDPNRTISVSDEIQALQSSIAMFPQGSDVEQRMQARMAALQNIDAQGNFTQIGALFNHASQLNSESLEAQQIGAQIFALQNQNESGPNAAQIAELANQAAQLNPDAPEFQQIHAKISALQNVDANGQPTELGQLFDVLSRLEPDSPEAQQIMAQIAAIENGQNGQIPQAAMPISAPAVPPQIQPYPMPGGMHGPMMDMMMQMMQMFQMMMQFMMGHGNYSQYQNADQSLPPQPSVPAPIPHSLY